MDDVALSCSNVRIWGRSSKMWDVRIFRIRVLGRDVLDCADISKIAIVTNVGKGGKRFGMVDFPSSP